MKNFENSFELMAATRPMFTTVPIVRTANERMENARNLPKINQLLGQIWQKGELHFIFADTGNGKSIFGVQAANHIAEGEPVLECVENDNGPVVVLHNDNGPVVALYYDFELSDRQFFQRYTGDDGSEFKFSDNLRIDNLDFALMMAENPALSFMELLQQKIRFDIEIIKPEVLFIDNITYLHTQNSADQQTALEIVRFLDGIKREYKISICVFAHTPKVDLSSPLTINSFAGSKQLPNFADGVSAIGKSEQGPAVRYLKQIKPRRNGEMIYDRENVISMQISKDGNFLHFDFLRCESEFNHLRILEKTATDERKLKAIDLSNAGKSVREIAKEIGVGKSTISNWIKEAQAENQKEFQNEIQFNDGRLPY